MASQMQITSAGLDALVNAQSGQTEAITITEIGITAAQFVMAPTLIALPGELKRIASVSGTSAAANIIHFNVQDASSDAYEVRGLGAYLADGTLFAVFSQDEVIFAKSDVVTFLLSFDVAFVSDVETAISFGDASFVFPPATEVTRGTIEIATQGEVNAATDAERAVTPRTLGQRLNAAIASEATARQSADSALAAEVTAAALLAKLLPIDGSGSNLDADLLDGQHGSYYANIAARLGYTPLNRAGDTMGGPLTLAGAPSASNHAATKAYIDGLLSASALLAKLLPIDGAGSGLDADLLDGHHASAFMREAASSHEANGYKRLADGWIIQWVSVIGYASGISAFTWPIAFPNAVFAAVPGGRQGLNFAGSYSAYLRNVDLNGGGAYAHNGTNGSGSSSIINVIAIGN